MKQLKMTIVRNTYITAVEATNDSDDRIYTSTTSVYDRLHSATRLSNKKSDRTVPCPACDERYMKELMPSKRSNDKSSLVRPFNVDSFKILLSKSTQYLNHRINEELQKLNEERAAKRNEDILKRKSKEVPTKKNMSLANQSRRSSYLLRKAKNYAQNYGYKSTESAHVVNNLNLAKIKHEISVKENNKRVKKFLDEPLFEKRLGSR